MIVVHRAGRERDDRGLFAPVVRLDPTDRFQPVHDAEVVVDVVDIFSEEIAPRVPIIGVGAAKIGRRGRPVADDRI